MNHTVLDNFNVRMKRMSWGAILAGVVVVLVTQLMLSLLGLAFGAGSIEPLRERNPVEGLGRGSAIWMGISTILSLFAGGWVSGRLAHFWNRTDATLHGAVTWGLSTLVGAYLLASAVGGVLSGAAGLIGRTANLIGNGVKSVAPVLGEAVDQLQIPDGGLASIRQEAERLMRQSGKSGLQPNQIERATAQTGKDISQTARTVLENPGSASDELGALWTRIEARGDRLLNEADREALVNILVARTDMSRQEARQTVARWQSTLDDVKTKVAETKAAAEQKAREAADATAKAVSKSAAWTFVGLLLGMLAAMGGGYLGALRKPLDDSAVSYQRIIEGSSHETAA